jgi:hypothetical protein
VKSLSAVERVLIMCRYKISSCTVNTFTSPPPPPHTHIFECFGGNQSHLKKVKHFSAYEIEVLIAVA